MARLDVFRPHRTGLQIFIVVALFVPAAVMVSATESLGSRDFLPRQIQGLEMGSDPAVVIEKIKGSGAYKTQGFPVGPRYRTILDLPAGPLVRRAAIRDRKRTQLVWTPTSGSYYKTVSFVFTEKLRLYMIRFALADSRRDGTKLKRSFFEEFRIPDEGPMRSVRWQIDTLLYGPGKDNVFFFEQTDARTGQKIFELFRRDISAQDRPIKAPAQKAAEVVSVPEAGQAPNAQPHTPAINASPEKAAVPETNSDQDNSPKNGAGGR